MKKIYLIIIFTSIIIHSYAQKNNDDLLEISVIENSLFQQVQINGDSLQKFSIQERMDFYKVPGVSIAIVENKKLKWAKGYGYANIKTREKINTNTLFQAGSISKPLAALSILKLYENDSLKLNKDINYYLKYWKITDRKFTKKQKVTLERLLSHTAGINIHGFPGYQQKEKTPTIIDVLNGEGNTGRIVVETIPGSTWKYSGGGYIIAQKVVEDITNKSFNRYMLDNILLPMGMKNSTYQKLTPENSQTNISSGYNSDGKVIDGLWHNYPEKAAAGLWTTPKDLALYCIKIQEIISGKKNEILKKRTLKKMFIKHKNNWGLGPALREENGSLIFEHTGKNAGFTNEMIANAEKGYALIIMTNSDNGKNLISEIKNAIFKYYKWSRTNFQTVDTLSLSNRILKKYVGKYELKEYNLIFDVQIKNNQLYIPNTPLGDFNLLSLTETEFIDKNTGTIVEFKINKMILDNNLKIEKIK